MKLGKLCVALVLVASVAMTASAPALSGATASTQRAAAIDDPEPISCPLCGGDATLHYRMVSALAAAGARQGVNLLRAIFG